MGEVGGIAIIADPQGAGEFTAYPDALRFIIAVRDDPIHVAAASSSKNAGLFLRQIAWTLSRKRTVWSPST